MASFPKQPCSLAHKAVIFIYVSFNNVETAKAVGKLLVEKRMAGSVDLMPSRSFNRDNDPSGQGEVKETTGAVMIIKTIDKHIQDIEDIIRENHHDGIPCIASIKLYRLNRDFKDWLIASTDLI
jgi:uncharacterized protein involved in tolerance to divalent cations